MEVSHLSSRPRIKTILNWGLKRSSSLLLRNLKYLAPVYRSEIKLIVIKCEISGTRDQIEPIEVSDSWVNRALKFNSN
jgi:hypothetical protein